MQWFSYDPEDGLETHDTPEQAKAAAEKSLDEYRDNAAGDGWYENVEMICWGAVHGQVVETKRVEIPDGVTVDDMGQGDDGEDYSLVHNSGFDCYLDYGMSDEPPPLMLVSGGGKITDDSRRAIEKFLKNKGLDNVMVMEVETTFNQADMDSAVDEERQRIAKLFCKDCASGRERIVSTLLGGTPHWFHPTGPASGRNCEAAALWGPTQP
jgi:hypothetical protein